MNSKSTISHHKSGWIKPGQFRVWQRTLRSGLAAGTSFVATSAQSRRSSADMVRRYGIKRRRSPSSVTEKCGAQMRLSGIGSFGRLDVWFDNGRLL